MAALATTPVRARVLGIPVNVSNDVFRDAVALHGAGGGQIVTLNAEMTMAARADPALGAAIEAAGMVIPDGAGVVWALGRQSHRVRRSPGIELARHLLEHAAAVGWRVALVGASPAVMDQLRERLAHDLPNLQLVFSVHGYQPPEAWPGLERQLLQARPDLVLVALGVPRQETWIQALPQPRAGLWMGVGGVSTSGPASRSAPPLDGRAADRVALPPDQGTQPLAAHALTACLCLGGVTGAPLSVWAVRTTLSGNRPRPARRRPAAGRTGG